MIVISLSDIFFWVIMLIVVIIAIVCSKNDRGGDK